MAINLLPSEILYRVFEQLHGANNIRALLVCKQWYTIVIDVYIYKIKSINYNTINKNSKGLTITHNTFISVYTDINMRKLHIETMFMHDIAKKYVDEYVHKARIEENREKDMRKNGLKFRTNIQLYADLRNHIVAKIMLQKSIINYRSHEITVNDMPNKFILQRGMIGMLKYGYNGYVIHENIIYNIGYLNQRMEYMFDPYRSLPSNKLRAEYIIVFIRCCFICLFGVDKILDKDVIMQKLEFVNDRASCINYYSDNDDEPSKCNSDDSDDSSSSSSESSSSSSESSSDDEFGDYF
jgi:hypothetical protein